MKLLPNDSGENVVSNVVPKWGIVPQIILWGLKTTHCALGGDAWQVTENYFAGYGTVQLRRLRYKGMSARMHLI